MITIRIAREEDLENLAEIYVKTYKAFDAGEKWARESAYKLLSYWHSAHPDLAFLAEFNNSIVGGLFIGLKPWWDGNRLVDGELFVDPKYQKRGIGRELIKHMLTESIKKYEVVSWDFTTFRNHEFPLAWYKKIGLKEAKEWTTLSGNPQEILSNM